ncbi:MAG: RNB domain-containing ribonuclease [Thermodesulfobacteriota bacterium]
MKLQRYDIVDYFDDKRICTGAVLDLEEKRLRVLSDRGQEAKITVSRVLSAARDAKFPSSGTRDEQVARLKALATRREQLKANVNLQEIWDVVSSDAEEVSAEDLAELVFGKSADPDSTAALLRAVHEDRIFFRIKPDHIEVTSPARVEQALVQMEKERERKEFVSRCADFLSRLGSGEKVSAASAPDGLIPLLEEAAEAGKDWSDHKTVKQILSHAEIASDFNPFKILVKLGVWSQDENIRLRAERVPIEFDPQAEKEAQAAAHRRPPTSAELFSDGDVIAIDSATTRDVDDALSITTQGDETIVGIHITDVAHFVDYDSLLDGEIRQRATSIYLPDKTIPMLPPELSEDAASLTTGQTHAAITVSLRVGPDYQIREFRIFPSLVRLKERLSYEQADQRIEDPNSPEAHLFRMAQAMRHARVAAGALIFRDPELAIRVDEEGRIEVSIRDREAPSQILVSEMMILANGLFARFMKEHKIPGLYRSQPPPAEKVELGEVYDPVASYRARKAMARGDVGLDPAPHSTLALDPYTTATSPLRRYPDLVVQRQVKTFLETGRPLLERAELEKILVEISYPLERATALERERQRYFLLKYLKQRVNQEFEAVVLQRFPRFHLVQIRDLCINGALATPNGLTLTPHDRALIRIEKVNPREDRLGLSLVKLL